MSRSGASDNDMLNVLWQARPHTRLEEALLVGLCVPEEAPAGLRPVAEAFAALRAPAGGREVARWHQALTAYREQARPAEALDGRRPFKASLFASRVRVRSTAAGAAVAALLGSGVAAAYTGILPAALQRFAHETIAAPAGHSGRPGLTAVPGGSRPGPGHPVGPSAAGSAAYGLCNAYQHAEQHGNASQQAVAFRNLARAAGGSGKVTAYCAGIPHPGATPRPASTNSHGKQNASKGSGNANGNGGNSNGSGGNGKGHGGNGNGNGGTGSGKGS